MTTPAALSVEALEVAVHQALKLWHSAESAGTPLQPLRVYQQLSLAGANGVRQASNQLLLQGLAALARSEPEAAEVLRLRFDEELAGYTIANRLNISEGNVWKKQNQGIHSLAQWLYDDELRLRSSQFSVMLSRLELPTYTELFGIDAALDQLAAEISRPEPPWLVAIEGLGGMGKTALADRLTRRLIATAQWNDCAWVTARQQVLNAGGGLRQMTQPALTVAALVDGLLGQLLPDAQLVSASMTERSALLRTRLQSAPHLVVIDNLETQQDIASLLDLLRSCANPTKFLLTTRHRMVSEPDIYHFGVPELDIMHALALLRQEARMRNLPDLRAASDDELRPIYAAVGGNPLALRLVAGQLHIYALDQVLAHLNEAQGQPVTNLYTYIYRQAWDALDEAARRTLVLMPLVTEQGANYDQLAKMSAGQLAPDELRSALDQLALRNLVDARGGLHERRYTIHSLTRTFLHQQVLHWGAA